MSGLEFAICTLEKKPMTLSTLGTLLKGRGYLAEKTVSGNSAEYVDTIVELLEELEKWGARGDPLKIFPAG